MTMGSVLVTELIGIACVASGVAFIHNPQWGRELVEIVANRVLSLFGKKLPSVEERLEDVFFRMNYDYTSMMGRIVGCILVCLGIISIFHPQGS